MMLNLDNGRACMRNFALTDNGYRLVLTVGINQVTQDERHHRLEHMHLVVRLDVRLVAHWPES